MKKSLESAPRVPKNAIVRTNGHENGEKGYSTRKKKVEKQTNDQSNGIVRTVSNVETEVAKILNLGMASAEKKNELVRLRMQLPADLSEEDKSTVDELFADAQRKMDEAVLSKVSDTLKKFVQRIRGLTYAAQEEFLADLQSGIGTEERPALSQDAKKVLDSKFDEARFEITKRGEILVGESDIEKGAHLTSLGEIADEARDLDFNEAKKEAESPMYGYSEKKSEDVVGATKKRKKENVHLDI